MNSSAKSGWPQDHGGNIFTGAGESPILADFSASINPLGHPEGLLEALSERWHEVLHYPDREVSELRRVLSKEYGIPVEHILCGNGSAELFELVFQEIAPRRLILSPPDFGLYRDRCPANIEVIEVPRVEGEGFAIDTEALIAEAREGDMVLFSNPGNPSGATVGREELIGLAKALGERGAFLAVDEAFIDYSPKETVLHLAGEGQRLLVFRSLTKFYAIPGIRLGFLAAEAELVKKLAGLQVPWSVSTVAQICGVKCFEDDSWGPRSREYLERARSKFRSALEAIPGFTVLPSGANFLLVKLAPPAPGATSIYERLKASGTLVRHCGSFGLGDEYLRFAVRTVGENADLVRNLNKLMGAL
ncbi:MAG: hypothetical protein C0609_09115 [Deltaproteobacteria bacterium]|nr:MAG: hypothetical protein C0609_09115 [Deltaproteobacteria bacterium]